MDRAALELLYPQGGYSSETGGKMANLRSLTNAQVARYHREAYRPDNMLVILSGTAKEEDFLAALEQARGLGTHTALARGLGTHAALAHAASAHALKIQARALGLPVSLWCIACGGSGVSPHRLPHRRSRLGSSPRASGEARCRGRGAGPWRR